MTKGTFERLQKLNAEAFDIAYRNAIVNAHESYYNGSCDYDGLLDKIDEIDRKAVAMLEGEEA